MLGSLANVLDPDTWLPGGRDAAFTRSLVALSAKMAVADGVVSVSEVKAFRNFVKVPEEDVAQIEWFFNLAQEDVAGFRSYAHKVKRLFSDNPETLVCVLEGLFNIAAADGMIHEGELEYLKDVSDIFGFDAVKFEQIAAQFMMESSDSDPYLILGFLPDVSKEELKVAYRELVLKHHPDRLMANGVPQEMADMGTERIAAINSAYDQISKVRSL
ncbi:MAG: DnaJ family molecular chaperone [Devosiaceae bacterium]|nr:DnaJ family molecular chaperone [Devosiaceae bacterium]